MTDKALAGTLKEMIAQPESGRPDFWVWLLTPAIGLSGSFVVLVTGAAAREYAGLTIGVWVWVLAAVIPGLKFSYDIIGYQSARSQGRRAYWRIMHAAADHTADYLQEQRAGTVRVEPVEEPEQRLIPFRTGGGSPKVLALNNEALTKQSDAAEPSQSTQPRWLRSPSGRRVQATAATQFLRRAYRLGSTARRRHEPHMSRDEYDVMMEFLVDCGLCDDKGQGGRPLRLATFGDALAHLHLNIGTG